MLDPALQLLERHCHRLFFALVARPYQRYNFAVYYVRDGCDPGELGPFGILGLEGLAARGDVEAGTPVE